MTNNTFILHISASSSIIKISLSNVFPHKTFRHIVPLLRIVQTHQINWTKRIVVLYDNLWFLVTYQYRSIMYWLVSYDRVGGDWFLIESIQQRTFQRDLHDKHGTQPTRSAGELDRSVIICDTFQRVGRVILRKIFPLI